MPSDINLVASRLFEPARCGSDHSFKEYFYSLADTGLARFTTERYISLATGHSCRTIAVQVRHIPSGENYVLCIDFRTPASASS